MKRKKKRELRQVTINFTSLSKLADSLEWHIKRGWRIDCISVEHVPAPDISITIDFQKGRKR